MQQIKEIIINTINNLYVNEEIDLNQRNYLNAICNSDLIRSTPTGIYYSIYQQHINYTHSHKALKLLIEYLLKGGDFLCSAQSKLNL